MPHQVSSAPATLSVIIGTAGHIDHGKTTLVRALTGVDTDRLPEEKRRGITIDLGFASLDAEVQDGSQLRISFIDVPGHAKFVRNMLAGVGGIDAVLLVVSAEEGIKPQTKEHLAICSLLGLTRGITVLTKADAVSRERLRNAEDAVRSYLRDTFLASEPLLAVSAETGVGIAKLRHELIRIAANVPARDPNNILRLPIDRAFVIHGFGTVVTGTLIGGSVRAGDELAIEPGSRTVKARSIQVHNRTEHEARAGSRVALNLTRVDAGEISRGDTLVGSGVLAAVRLLDAELTVLPDAPPLKHRSTVHFHAFASECIARVTLYDAALTSPGETSLARLHLSSPIVLIPGDRFILRQGSPITTSGGGRVLDVHPLAHTRKQNIRDWLRALCVSSPEEGILLRIVRRGVNGIPIKSLCRETGLAEGAFQDAIGRWIHENRIHCIDDRLLLAQPSCADAREAILQRLKARSGESRAVKRSELKEQSRLESEVFDYVLRLLERDRQVRVTGDFVAPFDAAVLPHRDHGMLSRIAVEYQRGGLSPPSPEELSSRLGIAPGEMRQLVTLLLRDKVLVRLGDDSLCVDRGALDRLAASVRTLRGQRLDIAAFKRMVGVSRKYAIPLLEYLDHERITAKQGNDRLVL